MTHSITLDIPESIYQPLVEAAEAQGRRVEDVALDKLSNGSSSRIEDPLDKYVGTIQGDIPDWADNHDKYIGEHLMREMRDEANE